jgi:hypothetical protein
MTYIQYKHHPYTVHTITQNESREEKKISHRGIPEHPILLLQLLICRVPHDRWCLPGFNLFNEKRSLHNYLMRNMFMF